MTFPPLPAPIAQALQARQYLTPTPVQAAILQESLAGADLVVSAQTGTGKTVAYGLALAQTLLTKEETFSKATAPRALIITPTRELALQVEKELVWLFKETQARIISCVGGMDPRRERQRLSEGAHIIVGTPGRIRDHIERGALNITGLEAVVLDEADDMLDLGFREDLEFILETTPATRRTLLFSATMPKPIIALAGRYQRNAQRLDIKGESSAHADIDYHAIRIAPRDVEHAVVNLLRFHESPGAFVFCNTREHVRHLQATLAERGFAVVGLSGELDQAERNRALQALRDGRARVCVATDVAARGIDLPHLGLVIHADLPHDAEALQHRSGRTGRAGRKGIAVLLVPMSRRRRAELILTQAGVKATWQGPPLPEAIYSRDQERLLSDPRLVEEPSEDERIAARLLLNSRPPEDIAAALVRFYRSQFPAAEEILDPGPQVSASQSKAPRRERSPTSSPDGRDKRARADLQDFSLFRLDLGRNQKAEPKWLLPMLCRRGKLTRGSIGKITVKENETFFGVLKDQAAHFLKVVGNQPSEEGIITAVEAVAGDRTGHQNEEPPRVTKKRISEKNNPRKTKKPMKKVRKKEK